MASLEERVSSLESAIQSINSQLSLLTPTTQNTQSQGQQDEKMGTALATVVESNNSTDHEGEPAAVDAKGRVWVRIGAAESAVKARVAAAWLLPKGGFQFLPRIGEEVHVVFENGDSSLPIIIGYNPGDSNSSTPEPLPYNPVASSTSSILAASKTIDQGDKPKDDEWSDYNPKTRNKYKSVIRSRSEDSGATSGKSSEIAFVNAPGEATLGLASEGDVRMYAGDDIRIRSDDDYVEFVGGDKSIKVEGDHTQSIKGTSRANNESHTKSWTYGDAQSFYFGNKNSLTIGLTISGFIGGTISVTAGLSASLKLAASFSASLTGEVVIIAGYQKYIVTGDRVFVVVGTQLSAIIGTSVTVVDGISVTYKTVEVDGGELKMEQTSITAGDCYANFEDADIDIEANKISSKIAQLNVIG